MSLLTPRMACSGLMLLVTACTDALPGPRPAEEPDPLRPSLAYESPVTPGVGTVTTTITFEGGTGNLCAGSNDLGGQTIAGATFVEPDWTPTDVLCSGLVNPPSPTHVALWTDGGVPGGRTITFDQPVTAVSLRYAATTDVTLEGFDAAGQPLASASRPANAPYGLDRWDPLGLSAAGITSVTLSGAEEFSHFKVFVDDLSFTRPAPQYPFSGFFQPVDDPSESGVVNRARAGSAIPVKFSLDGDRTLQILAQGYPHFVAEPCEGGPVDQIEMVAVGTGGLSYHVGSDTYTYVWKTDAAWAGECGRFVLGLDDGSTWYALFRFTR
jgi:hypothetical protein